MRYNTGMTNLTPKREAFCREYIIDCNGTQAAIRAGYAPKAAGQQAESLLKIPEIQSRLATLRASVQSAAIMEYSEACEMLTAMARGNMAHYVGVDGEIATARIVDTFPEAVSGLDSATTFDDDKLTRVTKLRLCDRVRVIDRLAKLRGWDQPARLQTEDVTPPRYDLTALTDTELAAFEAALAKVQA